MQKIIASIIISIGLITSASIIANKDKGVGRWQLFQGKMRETYWTRNSDGTGIDSTGIEDCILRIDTKTGEVDRYEIMISNKKDVPRKNGFYRVNY